MLAMIFMNHFVNVTQNICEVLIFFFLHPLQPNGAFVTEPKNLYVLVHIYGAFLDETSEIINVNFILTLKMVFLF